ncbi:MAG TPA: hypothetical protein VNR61_12460 [Niallia sp.]|nr:hypothetical protein [Niallia sp.]
MKDSTIDYSKILNALNHSLSLVEEDNEVTEAVKVQLSSAQQAVQQAMSYNLSRDIDIY